MRVDVYKNLQKGCLSIKSRETEDYGTVIGYEDRVVIDSPKFVVQSSGRERARESGVRNVHAFVRGELLSENNRLKSSLSAFESITYNPFKYEQFVHADSEEPVESAEVCVVSGEGVFARGLRYMNRND